MKRCPTCNVILKRGHGYEPETNYCSVKCYRDKSPIVLRVEAEFNDTIENLIKESEETYSSEYKSARSLGINRGTYRAWKIKFGG